MLGKMINDSKPNGSCAEPRLRDFLDGCQMIVAPHQCYLPAYVSIGIVCNLTQAICHLLLLHQSASESTSHIAIWSPSKPSPE